MRTRGPWLYLFDFTDHWQFAAEAIRLSGSLRQRVEIGLAGQRNRAPAAARRPLQFLKTSQFAGNLPAGAPFSSWVVAWRVCKWHMGRQ